MILISPNLKSISENKLIRGAYVYSKNKKTIRKNKDIIRLNRWKISKGNLIIHPGQNM